MKTQYSKHALYAAGEPLGDCITRKKLGGGYLCGGGSASGIGSDSDSSQKTTNNTTTNTLQQDRRMVNDNGAIGLSLDNSAAAISLSDSRSYTTTDHGAVKAGTDVALRAIEASARNADHVTAAGEALARTGFDMLAHSDDLAAKLNGASFEFARGVNSAANNVELQAMAQTRSALQVVTSLASKPLNMQDPAHMLVVAGLAVVGIVGVMAFKGK